MESTVTAPGRTELGTYAFFERVRDAVNADPEFRRATEWFDGSVLLRVGDLAVWMKWYKGQIIDMHEGPDPLGYTWAETAPLDVWRRIVDLPRNSYRPWAKLLHYGEIAVEGNVIEATRLTEARHVFLSHLHDLATGAGAA
jgi:hypothetical protein